MDKNASAEELIRWHFEVEPGLEVVYRAMAANEDDPNEPIKLLEVNTDAVQTREFPAFGFPPTQDFPYQTIIAEVTSEGLTRFQMEGKLPDVWDLHRAKRYLRQSAQLVPSRKAWADGYYAQASADWAMFREQRLRPKVRLSQTLHHLQIATEKLSKAYRFPDTTASAETLLTNHVGFDAFQCGFPHSQQVHRTYYNNRGGQLAAIRRGCEQLARLVEQLALAVGGAARPENAEYSWAQGGEVVVPVRYSFPSLDLRRHPHARAFLTFIQLAFEEHAAPQAP